MTDLGQIGSALNTWFTGVKQGVDSALFALGEPGPHRESIVLSTFMRNAEIVRRSRIDSTGQLYSPISLMLVSGAEKLKIDIRTSAWSSAAQSVAEMLTTSPDLYEHGLSHYSTAQLLKDQLDQALVNTGLAGAPTVGDEQSRIVALGYSVYWGMRFLLAYALECVPLLPSGRPDFAWIQEHSAQGGLHMTVGEQATPVVARLIEQRDFNNIQVLVEAMAQRAAPGIHRTLTNQKLRNVVAQRIRFDIIQPALGLNMARVSSWEDEFPNLIQALLGRDHETWTELVDGALDFRRPGALQRAVEVIEETIRRFNDAEELPAAT